MKAIKTVIAYQTGTKQYLESFITVAEKGANAVANLFNAHPKLLSQEITILSVTQYDHSGTKL